ncbi:MAG TPA: PQQ-binding-like beta-propeller repeat protein [Rhizomicrobium sp.]|jgi:outer membrane protein assembly factor BamB
MITDTRTAPRSRTAHYRATATFVCALATAAFVQPAKAADAVAYQMDIAHDGNTTMAGDFSAPLKRRWVRNLEGMVSYPLIAKGMVFVTVADTTNEGVQFYALSLKTGETIWHKFVGGHYRWANAAYDDGRVFLLDSDGMLQAFMADNSGKHLWTTALPRRQSSAPPVAVHGLVYADGSYFGSTLYAVDEQTGQIVWARLNIAGSSGVAVGDHGIYATYGCNFYKYEPLSGVAIWKKHNDCSGGSDGNNPAYYRKHLYFSNFGHGGYILDATDGHIVGPYLNNDIVDKFTPALWTSPTGGIVGFALNGDGLFSFDGKTGAPGWTFSDNGQVTVSPIVLNNLVVVGSNSGMLYMLDAATGKQVSATKVGAPITTPFAGTLFNAPNTGFAASAGVLVVPASNVLVAYDP